MLEIKINNKLSIDVCQAEDFLKIIEAHSKQKKEDFLKTYFDDNLEKFEETFDQIYFACGDRIELAEIMEMFFYKRLLELNNIQVDYRTEPYDIYQADKKAYEERI